MRATLFTTTTTMSYLPSIRNSTLKGCKTELLTKLVSRRMESFLFLIHHFATLDRSSIFGEEKEEGWENGAAVDINPDYGE